MNQADTAHKVLISVLVLVGASFVFQGVADSSSSAHTLILALLVGVVLVLGIREGVNLPKLAKYPWLPSTPGGG